MARWFLTPCDAPLAIRSQTLRHTLVTLHELIATRKPHRTLKHIMLKGHCTFMVQHNAHPIALHRAHPIGKLRNVRNRCRQAKKAPPGGHEDEAFLPDTPTSRVIDIMNFVKNYVGDIAEAVSIGMKKVAKNFSSHDEHGRVRLNDNVTRQDTDVFLAEVSLKFFKLLVAQRLNRRRVY